MATQRVQSWLLQTMHNIGSAVATIGGGHTYLSTWCTTRHRGSCFSMAFDDYWLGDIYIYILLLISFPELHTTCRLEVDLSRTNKFWTGRDVPTFAAAIAGYLLILYFVSISEVAWGVSFSWKTLNWEGNECSSVYLSGPPLPFFDFL